jgi:hypothetical protein
MRNYVILNSVSINAAADLLWKWERMGRSDGSLWEKAKAHVADYCEGEERPDRMAAMILDAIQITVRIANGFPPNNGVVHQPEPATILPFNK